MRGNLTPSSDHGMVFYSQMILLINRYINKEIQNEKRKKRSERCKTLRTGCSKVQPKTFVPPQKPFPGAQDGQNLISWRWSLPSPTTKFGENLCTQFRVIVVTDTDRPPARHRQDRLQHTAPLCLARSVNIKINE